jgi:hypothetical protein
VEIFISVLRHQTVSVMRLGTLEWNETGSSKSFPLVGGSTKAILPGRMFLFRRESDSLIIKSKRHLHSNSVKIKLKLI